MKTKSFTKKTYEVYDNNHFVLYFNEQESDVIYVIKCLDAIYDGAVFDQRAVWTCDV